MADLLDGLTEEQQCAVRRFADRLAAAWHAEPLPAGDLDWLEESEEHPAPLLDDGLTAPIPYFGGKREIAALVWERFGDVTNYVEPAAGSCAVLLARPRGHTARVETANDLDALVVNFWRATKADPEGVAWLADYPVLERDLHVRHRWLIARRVSLAIELDADPEAFDPRAAAWWAWGASAWIGASFCAESEVKNGKRPKLAGDGGPRPGDGVHSQGMRLPSAANAEGLKRPDLGGGNGGPSPKVGRGIHAGAMREIAPNAEGFSRPALSGGDGRGARAKKGTGVHAGGMREPTKLPNLIGGADEPRPQYGHGLHSAEQRGPSKRLPDLSGGRHWDGESPQARNGKGLHGSLFREPSRQLPDLGGSSRGDEVWPNTGKGLNASTFRTVLYDSFQRLAQRLRYVRFACGSWDRLISPAVTWKHGLTGVFIDLPYGHAAKRTAKIYAKDNLDEAARARAYALEAGKRKDMRIAICGYEGEHDELERHGWSVVAWKARGGFGNQAKKRGRENAHRERVWFSPHCLGAAQGVLRGFAL